jgi:hypothetical protein
MGAWGANTFDNDTACDWTHDLEGAKDLSFVRETLARVTAAGSAYLDSDGACAGLAACEVLARLKGNWGVRDAYTETVDKWVSAHEGQPPADLIAAALSVINRVLSPPSELLELWSESDDEEWHAAVADLRARVSS